MSRVGKQQLIIPEKTTVTYTDSVLKVVGPLGTLHKTFGDFVDIAIVDGMVTFVPKAMDPFSRAIWGTYASHVKNMITGVNAPYIKKLILDGVGFKSEVKAHGSNSTINLALGFSHPVVVPIPEGLAVTAEKNTITISGIDKELVGQFAARVRALKKPEPYKGKGFHYSDEVIRRKAGKKTA